jgi:hypothetical protein
LKQAPAIALPLRPNLSSKHAWAHKYAAAQEAPAIALNNYLGNPGSYNRAMTTLVTIPAVVGGSVK